MMPPTHHQGPGRLLSFTGLLPGLLALCLAMGCTCPDDEYAMHTRFKHCESLGYCSWSGGRFPASAVHPNVPALWLRAGESSTWTGSTDPSWGSGRRDWPTSAVWLPEWTTMPTVEVFSDCRSLSAAATLQRLEQAPEGSPEPEQSPHVETVELELRSAGDQGDSIYHRLLATVDVPDPARGWFIIALELRAERRGCDVAIVRLRRESFPGECEG